MDDLLTGSNSIDEVVQIKSQVTNILATAGFELTKWCSNDPRLLEQQQTNSTTNFSKNDDVKVLGFFWNCRSDELEYRVKIPNDNPADIVSRGMLPRQLRQSELWWHGPQWLKSDASKWPSSWQNPHNKEDHLFAERKLSKPVNIINAEPELPVLQKFSSVKKLCRVIAYILRFVNNLKTKTKNQKALSVEELEHARLVVLKYIQSRELADEIRCIQKSKKLKCQRLAKLDPFIDKNGLLRVGGRLKHSLLAYESKFPILLPEKHHVTKSIIRETHEDELHAGNEATLAAVRQRYWPISGRNFVRKIIHSCVKCNRANPKPISQKMGDLPKERLQPSRPFSTSGVDYAGPYLIKSSKLRNAKKVKSYIARFVCFSTKAVHLELVKYFQTTVQILSEPNVNYSKRQISKTKLNVIF
jgi:hypothetical protein